MSAPHVIAFDAAIVDGSDNAAELFHEMRERYFAGMACDFNERSGSSPVATWEKRVAMYRNERGEWMGTAMVHWSYEAESTLAYVIPSGPAKGQRVNHYWHGKLRKAQVIVSLSPRHHNYEPKPNTTEP